MRNDEILNSIPKQKSKMTNYGSCCNGAGTVSNCNNGRQNVSHVSHSNKQNDQQNDRTINVISSESFKEISNELSENEDENQRKGNKNQNKAFLFRIAKRVPGFGIMLSLCASFFLGSAGMLVKLTQSVHGIQIAVLRACIQLIIYGIILAFRRIKPVPYDRKELFGVLGRALFGAISITCSYCCLRLIPLGDATSIRFSLPIWTLIISYFWLGESCSLIKICSVIVSVSGVVLIAKPDDCIYFAHLILYNLNLESENVFMEHVSEHELAQRREFEQTYASTNNLVVVSTATNESERNGTSSLWQIQDAALDNNLLSEASAKHFKGCLMALASSICLSLSLISLRFCKRTPVEVSILWLSVSCITVGTITLLALDEWNLPDNLRDVFYIILNGFCGAIGQWFITSALKIEQSGMIALARTFDIEVAFLYSALLLHEQIRATSVIGSILVSGGVIAVVVSKLIASRQSRLSESLDSDGDSTGSDKTKLEHSNGSQVYANIRIEHQSKSPGDDRNNIPAGVSVCSKYKPARNLNNQAQWRRHSDNVAAAGSNRASSVKF